MPWPMSADYAMMLQNPPVAFKDPELKKSTIKRNSQGQPLGMSGAFAIVYKATLPAGGHRAVRVFTSARDGRGDTYRAISDYLARHKHLSSLVEFQYVDKGVRGGDGKFYPLVTMEWVAGTTLFDWVQRHCQAGDKARLSGAVERWSALVDELGEAQIAHGDLQHANVMVTDNHELKLVDYDCMCVPQLVGRPNLELGVEPYQHPQRNPETLLSSSLDNFSGIFIYVALRALAAQPQLWQEFVEKLRYDKLLIRKEDFDSPDSSPLFQTLRRSPDPEVARLLGQLCELHRAPIDQVPPLGELLFSYDKVRSLLSQKLYDEAVELINRSQPRRAAPADLTQPLQDARQRVACWQDLQARIKAGDEAGMQALATSPLLQNYPAARGALQEAQLAPQAVAWLAKLDAALRATRVRELVQLWDAESSRLARRTSAKRFQAEVDRWRERNRLCDALLTLLARPQVSADSLEQARTALRAAGGHPDITARESELNTLLERLRVWESLAPFLKDAQRVPQRASDQRLLQLWNDSLLAGWPPAQQAESIRQAARVRVAAADEVERTVQSASKSLSPAEATRLRAALAQFPAGYLPPALVQTGQTAIQRAEACHVLRGHLSAGARSAVIVEAADALAKLQGDEQLEAHEKHQVDLARRRLKKIREVTQVSRQLPRDQLDAQLLKVWDTALLKDCPEVDDWREAHALALRTQNDLRALEAAIRQNDDAAIFRAYSAAGLEDYPLPPAWTTRIRAAEERIGDAHRLADALARGQQAAFVKDFQARVVRTYASLFVDHRALLEEWLQQHILQRDFVGLAPPRGKAPLVIMRDQVMGDQVLAHWIFPRDTCSDTCVVGMCAGFDATRDTPVTLKDSRSARLWEIGREDYRQHNGGRRFRFQDDYAGLLVVVWAKVDLGELGIWYSQPLELGRITAPKAGRRRTGWGGR
ncbi:MAG: hypothetical protein U0935_02760 [Pirellulales bacterium]